jgi:hypothetical protein
LTLEAAAERLADPRSLQPHAAVGHGDAGGAAEREGLGAGLHVRADLLCCQIGSASVFVATRICLRTSVGSSRIRVSIA